MMAELEYREEMASRTRVLDKELERLRQQIGSLERELDETPDYGLGRGAPFVTRWGLDQALLQQLKEKVSRMEQALMSGASEKYGVCSRCGQPIHPDRLAVLPDTDLCVACAKSGAAHR